MQLKAKTRLRATDEYGWYLLSESDHVMSGPYQTEAQAQRNADLHHSQEIGIKVEYGCETNGVFESLLQHA